MDLLEWTLGAGALVELNQLDSSRDSPQQELRKRTPAKEMRSSLCTLYKMNICANVFSSIESI
jgi:hypothetical protein